MRITDVETLEEIAIGHLGFELTLEGEADVTYARGSIRTLDENVTYPIQSSAALLDALIEALGVRCEGGG